jgi:IclR family KDG regulon transcriptional repressor
MDRSDDADLAPPSPGALQTTKLSFEIIERIKTAESIGPTQLADELDVAKSTVHRHLSALTELGYLLESKGEYSLGLRFLDLGDQARDRYDLLEVIKPELDELARDVEERAQFMVVENNQAAYIYQTKHSSGILSGSHIGTHNPLHATAIGKAYLAAHDEEKRREIVDQLKLTDETLQTITDQNELLKELEKVDEQGFAVSRQEMKEGIYAVGVPVRDDATEEIVGGVSIAAPETRVVETSFIEEAAEKLQSVSRIIGLKATY